MSNIVEISKFIDHKGNTHPTLTITVSKYKKITMGARNWSYFVDSYLEASPEINKFIEAHRKEIEAQELRQFMSKQEFRKYCEKNNVRGV